MKIGWDMKLNDAPLLSVVTKKVATFLILLVFPSFLLGQTQLVFNSSDAYMVMKNSVYLVVDNANSNAIVDNGGGNIISEHEENKVRWNIGTSGSGSYTVPFTDEGDLDKLPLTFDITTAGSGGSGLDLSTYGRDGDWENSTYLPNSPGVTHFAGLNGQNDNSANAVDRFWMIETQGGYTDTPEVDLTFTYVDDEHDGGNNNIESNLKAQRFNTEDNLWADWGPSGTVNTGDPTGTVSGVSVSQSNLFAPWTLADHTEPLPVELTDLKGECAGKGVRLEWTTASETNSDYFAVERSLDGQSFERIGKVQAAGNSSTEQEYSFADPDPFSTTYYRLKQVDFDGNTEYYGSIAVEDCPADSGKGLDVVMKGNGEEDADLAIQSEYPDQKFRVTLYSFDGRVIEKRERMVRQGLNEFPVTTRHDLALGIYMLSLENERHSIRKKVLLK